MSFERSFVTWVVVSGVGVPLSLALVRGLGAEPLGGSGLSPLAVAAGAVGLSLVLALLEGLARSRGWSRTVRWALALVPAVGLSLAVGAAEKGSWWVALAPVALAVFFIAASAALGPRLPAALDGALKRRPKLALSWGVLALLAVLQTVRIGSFLFAPGLAWASTFPPDRMTVSHMCLSAYIYAADLSRQGRAAAIYAPETYSEYPVREELGTSVENLEPFLEDAYVYPPPFLLLPRLALRLSDDFLVLRSGWYVLQALAILAGFGLLAAWIGGRAGLVAGLLIPALWISVPTNFNFQFGQFHGAALVLSVLAMVAFDSRRRAWGGLALAVAVLAKISPGILVVYLAAQRRWRELAWVGVFALTLTAAAWAVVGSEAFAAFWRDQVPRLLGAASGAADERLQVVINDFSLQSVGTKVSLLGSGLNAEAMANLLSWVFTLAILLGALWLSRFHRLSRLGRAQLWLVLLTLAALRAPAAPAAYVVVSGLWLLTLVAGEVRSVKGALGIAGLWVLWQGLPPLPSKQLLLVLSLLVQLLYLSFPVWVSVRLRGRAATDTPEPESDQGGPSAVRV